MAIIEYRKPWRRQPQSNLRLNPKWLERGLLRSWNFAQDLEIATGESLVRGSNEISNVGAHGRALETSGTSVGAPLQFLASSAGLPMGGCTVIFASQRITTGTTSQEAKPAFNVGAAGTTTGELHAFVPYGPDGKVYWRYGNGTGISVAQTVGLEANIWGFAAGTAKGREIWRNGAKVASDATNIQRTATTAALRSGTNDGTPPTPLHRRFALHIFDEQLTDAEIAFLTSPAGLWDVYAPRSIWVPVSAGGGSVALTGTVTTATEADIVAGGKTIILTLTGDTFVAAGATFDAQRANIIAGLDSAQSELLGWDNVVKALQGVSGVVRTSDTVCTITLDAQATYSITANETITATIPASALSGGVAIVAAPTFQVTEGSGASFFASWASRSTQMVGGGVYA